MARRKKVVRRWGVKGDPKDSQAIKAVALGIAKLCVTAKSDAVHGYGDSIHWGLMANKEVMLGKGHPVTIYLMDGKIEVLANAKGKRGEQTFYLLGTYDLMDEDLFTQAASVIDNYVADMLYKKFAKYSKQMAKIGNVMGKIKSGGGKEDGEAKEEV